MPVKGSLPRRTFLDVVLFHSCLRPPAQFQSSCIWQHTCCSVVVLVGPTSGWGQGGGRSAGLCSLRFASHLPPHPLRENPRGAGCRRFWKLVEWSWSEAHLCFPGGDCEAVVGARQPRLWPDFFTGPLGTRSQGGVKHFGLGGGCHKSDSALSPPVHPAKALRIPKMQTRAHV